MIKTNPVFMRGIKSRMRGVRAPILISIYLAVIAGIFALVYMSSDTADNGYYGPAARVAPVSTELVGKLYLALVIILFAMIALMVPALNAGTISSERERQTLDLLLSSPLSARKIVSGNLLSCMSFVAFLLVLAMPVFAIVFLFGTLSMKNILLLFLYMMICAYACASVAMFFSCMVKKTFLATILSYTILLLFVVVTLLVGYNIYAKGMADINYTPYGSEPETLQLPFVWKINPIISLIGLGSSDLSGSSPTGSVYPGSAYIYYDMGMGGFGILGSAIGVIASDVKQSYLYYSSALMLAASVILNIAGTVLLKPVKKFQIGK